MKSYLASCRAVAASAQGAEEQLEKVQPFQERCEDVAAAAAAPLLRTKPRGVDEKKGKTKAKRRESSSGVGPLASQSRVRKSRPSVADRRAAGDGVRRCETQLQKSVTARATTSSRLEPTSRSRHGADWAVRASVSIADLQQETTFSIVNWHHRSSGYRRQFGIHFGTNPTSFSFHRRVVRNLEMVRLYNDLSSRMDPGFSISDVIRASKISGLCWQMEHST